MDSELYCVDEVERVNRCKNRANKEKNKPFCDVDSLNKCTKARGDGYPHGYKKRDGISVNLDEQVYGTTERVDATVERLRTLKQEDAEMPSTSGVIPISKRMTKSQSHLAAIKANITVHPKARITDITSQLLDVNIDRTNESIGRRRIMRERERIARELITVTGLRRISDEEQSNIIQMIDSRDHPPTGRERIIELSKEYYTRQMEEVIYHKYKQRNLDLNERGKLVIRDYIGILLGKLLKNSSDEELTDDQLMKTIERFPGKDNSGLKIAITRYHIKDLLKQQPSLDRSVIIARATKMTEDELSDLTKSSFFKTVELSPEFEYYDQQAKLLGSIDTVIVSSNVAHNPATSYVPMKLIENRTRIRELFKSHQL